MKFKAMAVLCIFVLGVFAILIFNSDYADAELSQSRRRMEWLKMDGLNWTQDHEDGVRQKFHELKIVLEDLHNVLKSEKNPERMGLLLNRQGTLIRDGDKFITGEKNIADFFKTNRGQQLTIDQMQIIDVGFINRVVEGHKVDHYVKLRYNIKLELKEGGEILENHDFPSTMILMHRHNCPWDG
jgi:hypothetical protein